MKRTLPIKTSSSVPGIIASCALLSSIANLVTGIGLLASHESGGDIALGVLTTVFAVWGIAGSIVALVFIIRQNRYNRSQANFIAQVSHELRTPLTSIRMYADTLLMHRFKDEAEENELLAHMNEEIQRLENLTEQILEARQQKAPTSLEAIDIGKTLSNALQPYLDDPDNAERLDIRMDENLPEIHVDANDFTNMASNLVRNALTHGGPGCVHITLKHADERCILTVRDEGTGIPKAWRKQIFEPFERGFNTTDSGIPGFGLGLSIVKDFATQYNAELTVDDHPDGGAIFTVALKV